MIYLTVIKFFPKMLRVGDNWLVPVFQRGKIHDSLTHFTRGGTIHEFERSGGVAYSDWRAARSGQSGKPRIGR